MKKIVKFEFSIYWHRSTEIVIRVMLSLYIAYTHD